VDRDISAVESDQELSAEGKRRRTAEITKRALEADDQLAKAEEAVTRCVRRLDEKIASSLHYMRGPGPKWREKHDWAEIDGASPAVTRALMAGLRP
jgi:hypothetical protein